MTDRRELLAMVGALALTPRAFAQSSPPSAQNLAVLPPITVDADVLARLPGMLKEQFPATLGLCITQRDRILLDYRREGASKDDLFRVYSITKSVLAMLVGIAHDRRFIASLDRSIASYFPEIDLSAADPRARDVTIRHVLMMTAGWNTAGNTGIQPPPVTTSGLFRPFHANPGETFIYDNNASNILGILLARAVGQPLDVFAEEVLFRGTQSFDRLDRQDRAARDAPRRMAWPADSGQGIRRRDAHPTDRCERAGGAGLWLYVVRPADAG
jgi:CubicO group peptidase (beta-lactamase class C family)